MDKFRDNIAFIEMAVLVVSIILAMILVLPNYGTDPGFKGNVNIIVLGCASMLLTIINLVVILPFGIYLYRKESKHRK